jgi:integrase
VARLLAAADSEWKGVISLAYFAGFRPLDASNLKRSNLDLQNKVITFVPQKTMHAARRRGRKPKALTIPLHASLLSVLQDLAQEKSGDAPLFPSLIGKQTSGRSGLSQEFIALMETKAGVDGLKQAPSVLGVEVTKSRNKPRTLRAKTFHSLRHTFITELRKEGVDLETRQDLAGHEDQEQTRHYTHLDVDVLRRAIDRLSSLPAVSIPNPS